MYWDGQAQGQDQEQNRGWHTIYNKDDSFDLFVGVFSFFLLRQDAIDRLIFLPKNFNINEHSPAARDGSASLVLQHYSFVVQSSDILFELMTHSSANNNSPKIVSQLQKIRFTVLWRYSAL